MSNVDSGRENNLQQESEHCDGIIDTVKVDASY